MMSAEDLLQELLDFAGDPPIQLGEPQPSSPTPTGQDSSGAKKESTGSHVQWALGGNSKFQPVGATIPVLKPGIYEPFSNGNSEWGLEQMSIASDGIYRLPDMATDTILNEVEKFWKSEDRYRKHNLLFKRGLLLWGDPGSGKTVTCKILMHELVKAGGVVIVAFNIPLLIECLKALRRIEPERRLIVVLEDIDEIIRYNGESTVLSMLDGESNVDKVLNLATTNYPDKLGARIINRPSRFDRVIFVGMPSDDARRVYIEKSTGDAIGKDQLEQWVEDTEGFSIAHIRELVAAVHCLDQPYAEVLDRLRRMTKPIEGKTGFKEETLGFTKKVATRTPSFSLASNSRNS